MKSPLQLPPTRSSRYLAGAFSGFLLAVAPALASTPLSTSEWDKDIVLGSGESYATHAKPINTNLWFSSDLSLSGGGGLTDTGTYAVQERNF
jgi:hypothetical protein